jgi:hypothetical protein
MDGELFNFLGHLLNVVVGLLLGWFVFEHAVFHTLGSVAIVYLLLQIAPRYVIYLAMRI